MAWTRSRSGPASQRAASSIASKRADTYSTSCLPVDVRVLGEHGGGVHEVADALGGTGRRRAAVAFQQPAQAAPERALHRGRRHGDRFALVDQWPAVGQRTQPPPLVRVRAGHSGGGQPGQLRGGRVTAGRCRVRRHHGGTQLGHQRRQRQPARRPAHRQLQQLVDALGGAGRRPGVADADAASGGSNPPDGAARQGRAGAD